MRVNKNKSVPFCWKPNTLFMQILRKILSLKRGLTVLFRPKVWPLCLLPLLKLSDMWPRHTMLLLRERHGWRRKCQFLRLLKDNDLYVKFQTLELTHCCFLDWTLYLRGLPGHLRGFLFLALGRIPSLIVGSLPAWIPLIFNSIWHEYFHFKKNMVKNLAESTRDVK